MGRRLELILALRRGLIHLLQESTWEGPQAPDRVPVIEGEEAGETITVVTDTGDLLVHTTEEGLHLHVQDTDTELDPEATLHVVITEIRWEC